MKKNTTLNRPPAGDRMLLVTLTCPKTQQNRQKYTFAEKQSNRAYFTLWIVSENQRLPPTAIQRHEVPLSRWEAAWSAETSQEKSLIV